MSIEQSGTQLSFSLKEELSQMNNCSIDPYFDFNSDTPPNKDPDSFSPTLRRYHKILWNKPLPNGELFELIDSKPKAYLYHKSCLGKFFLGAFLLGLHSRWSLTLGFS